MGIFDENSPFQNLPQTTTFHAGLSTIIMVFLPTLSSINLNSFISTLSIDALFFILLKYGIFLLLFFLSPSANGSALKGGR